MLLDTNEITLGTFVFVEHFPGQNQAPGAGERLTVEPILSKSPKSNPTNLTLVYEVVLAEPQGQGIPTQLKMNDFHIEVNAITHHDRNNNCIPDADEEDCNDDDDFEENIPNDDDEEDQEDDQEEDEELNRKFSRCNDSEDDVVFEYDDAVDDISFEDSTVETPEWFSHEDKEQLSAIFEVYSDALQLKEEQQRRIREPPKFIGRVKRCKVTNDDGVFQTLDIVDVYRRALVAPGTVMPFVKTVYMLTTWMADEGIPSKCLILSPSKKKFWESKIEIGSSPSYLYCQPVFFTSSDYDFSVDVEEHDVRHSNLSYPHHRFDNHIPDLSFTKNRRTLCLSPTGSPYLEDENCI